MPPPRSLVCAGWFFLLLLALIQPLSSKKWEHWAIREEEVCASAQEWAYKPGLFCTTLWHSPYLTNQTELEARERRAIFSFCELDRALERFDCSQEYSVNVRRGQCGLCRQAYREWACGMVTDTLATGELDCASRLMPCPSCASICHQVMRLCPYLSPDRMQIDLEGRNLPQTSQYGGHPAFYCPLENDDPSDPAYTSLCYSQLSEDFDYVHHVCTTPPQQLYTTSKFRRHAKGQSQGTTEAHTQYNDNDKIIFTSPSSTDEEDWHIIPHYTTCCWTYASALVILPTPRSPTDKAGSPSPLEDEEEDEDPPPPQYGSDAYFFQNATDNRVILNCCDTKGTCNAVHEEQYDGISPVSSSPQFEPQQPPNPQSPQKPKKVTVVNSQRKRSSEQILPKDERHDHDDLERDLDKIITLDGSGSLDLSLSPLPPHPTHSSNAISFSDEYEDDDHYLDTEPDSSEGEEALHDHAFSTHLPGRESGEGFGVSGYNEGESESESSVHHLININNFVAIVMGEDVDRLPPQTTSKKEKLKDASRTTVTNNNNVNNGESGESTFTFDKEKDSNLKESSRPFVEVGDERRLGENEAVPSSASSVTLYFLLLSPTCLITVFTLGDFGIWGTPLNFLSRKNCVQDYARKEGSAGKKRKSENGESDNDGKKEKGGKRTCRLVYAKHKKVNFTACSVQLQSILRLLLALLCTLEPLLCLLKLSRRRRRRRKTTRIVLLLLQNSFTRGKSGGGVLMVVNYHKLKSPHSKCKESDDNNDYQIGFNLNSRRKIRRCTTLLYYSSNSTYSNHDNRRVQKICRCSSRQRADSNLLVISRMPDCQTSHSWRGNARSVHIKRRKLLLLLLLVAFSKLFVRLKLLDRKNRLRLLLLQLLLLRSSSSLARRTRNQSFLLFNAANLVAFDSHSPHILQKRKNNHLPSQSLSFHRTLDTQCPFCISTLSRVFKSSDESSERNSHFNLPNQNFAKGNDFSKREISNTTTFPLEFCHCYSNPRVLQSTINDTRAKALLSPRLCPVLLKLIEIGKVLKVLAFFNLDLHIESIFFSPEKTDWDSTRRQREHFLGQSILLLLGLNIFKHTYFPPKMLGVLARAIPSVFEVRRQSKYAIDNNDNYCNCKYSTYTNAALQLELLLLLLLLLTRLLLLSKSNWLRRRWGAGFLFNEEISSLCSPSHPLLQLGLKLL